MEEPAVTPALQPSLRRRNSIATSVVIPTRLALPSKPFHTSSFPAQEINGGCNGAAPAVSFDFELASFKSSSSSSYTSLKDVLPFTAVNSPTAAASIRGSACEISIRHHLVKSAAWAYLQPMSSSPDASSENFIRRLWLRVSAQNPVGACIRFVTVYVIPCIAGPLDWIFRLPFQVQVSR